MHYFNSLTEQNRLPQAADPDRARAGIERWLEAANAAESPETADLAATIAAQKGGKRLLQAIFGNSPYLTQCAVGEPEFTCRLLTKGPDSALSETFEILRQSATDSPSQGDGEAYLAKRLRIAKRRMSLAVGVADITGTWGLNEVTRALSDFADQAISAATAHLLKVAAAAGSFTLADPSAPENGSGLVILGLGKLGGRELNYSSDVDLIVLFDPARINTQNPDELQNCFVRLTRNLVRLLEERTADGYVFRVDLRLRPDPGATPLAISVEAAETYYESIGQNWERAALIKARPVAGDGAAAKQFLNWLTPFIWRKNLDFAAIQDIHSIKRQINAHRGGETIKVGGHNVKLGRGGIREIEFFAQTQQLIWGGRMPELRVAPTREALAMLTQCRHIDATVRDDLVDAYSYLRRVEHRLQMIDDKQTHSLPEADDALTAVAVFLGYDSMEDFAVELTRNLKAVEHHYANLFEDAPSLGADDAISGNLVFTGGDSDPETIETIRRLGFENAETVDATVRGWHHGRYRAMRSARARELLTEIFPVLLKSLAGTPDPDATFLKFDEFLSGLPSGVQLFSMFYANPGLLNQVAEIMGGAPRLAEYLSRRPQVLESVLTKDFFDPPPPQGELAGELDRMLETAANIEDVLVACRRWANDRRFQIGVQSLTGNLQPADSAAALSDIADTAISRLYRRIKEDFIAQHGTIPGEPGGEESMGMAVVAMGKLGSRELTPESDLDLIFIYDLPTDAGPSDGQKSLMPSQYYARLSQRLINSITAQTSEGDLYEVDMRLRPSGTSGPIASSFEAFIHYHQDHAWTWEHMALTKVRIIEGPPELCRKIEGIVAETLTRERNPDELLLDVADMRMRMDREYHTEFIWDVKHLRGGLIDVEFIVQYLQLRHAHEYSQVLNGDARVVLDTFGQLKILDTAQATDLIAALDLWRGLQGMLRLTIPRNLRKRRDHDIPEALQSRLAHLGGVKDFAALVEKIQTTAATALGHYNAIVHDPALKLKQLKDAGP